MKTQTQIDRATDLRLQRTYGITLDEYNQMLKNQNGVCAICGNPPKSRRLHVDHDHGWKKIKIYARKILGAWYGHTSIPYCGDTISTLGPRHTKTVAIRQIKSALLRRSVRGLLCAHCNRGLRYYKDNPVFMESAARYLRKHQGTLKAA